MSAQIETLELLQPWRIGNTFTLTLRGHWQKVPDTSSEVTLYSEYDPYANSEQYNSQIRDVLANHTNYLTLYDSFYAPVDFKLSGMTFRMPSPLPKNAQFDIEFKVNGGVVEKLIIPEFEDHNMKKYGVDCDFLIYEDDLVEISVRIRGYDSLSFNQNNLICSIAGCTSYVNYKELWADVLARAATTKEIVLSGTQTVDGVALQVGDTVLVKNQSTITENGLYTVQPGGWSRLAGYPTTASLDGVTIHVTEGNTLLSDDTTNYTAYDSGGDYYIGFPLIAWESGDNWYKTNVHLQNRSGNDTIKDRIFLDMIKSPMEFLFQGIRFSLFEDYLRVVDKIAERIVCVYLDILVNGKSLLPYTNFPRPLQIDTSLTYRSYDLALFNDDAGFPIRFGDNLDVRVYLSNQHIKYNGKLTNVQLYGCSPDCAAFDSPIIAVYQPCAQEPCVWKFSQVQRCEPESIRNVDPETGEVTGPTPYNPEVNPVVPDVPNVGDYVVANGIYVTINGEKIYV